MVFRIPLDAYVLALPMTYACAALTGLIWKTIYMDPEVSSIDKYYNTSDDDLREQGDRWNNNISQLFHDRIKKKRFSVFGTNFYCDKQ
jgi:hypothetical protein